jgi:hypothetical protein
MAKARRMDGIAWLVPGIFFGKKHGITTPARLQPPPHSSRCTSAVMQNRLRTDTLRHSDPLTCPESFPGARPKTADVASLAALDPSSPRRASEDVARPSAGASRTSL